MTRIALLFTAASLLSFPALAQSEAPPQAEIGNGLLHAKLYLPDAKSGYYRGTRFDWSGVIYSLEYHGHDFYGPWFTKTDPTVRDFIYDGPDITAGPCSAITGPVDEFSTNGEALGFSDAKPGGTFVKIGVGVLRKLDDQKYSPYRLYDIVNPGEWDVQQPNPNIIEFTHTVADSASGYAYLYTKRLRLVKDQPRMTITHTLKNLGRRPILSDVYDHNFLVLDKQPTGPDFVITLPYAIQTKEPVTSDLAEIRGNQILYRKLLQDRDTFAAGFEGFGKTAASYDIRIQNAKIGMGMRISGDRPLSKEALWSIRSVLAVEPFISMSINPQETFTWTYTYSYYGLRPSTAAKPKP